MKFLNKVLFIAAFAAVLGLASCNNDDDGGNQLSKTDAKAKLDEFNATASGDLQSLNNTDGLSAIKDMFDLVDVDDPFSRVGNDKKSIQKFFRAKGREFKTFFVPKKATGARTTDDEAFDFDAKKGVYEWNPEDEQFVKTGEANIIKIFFPTEGSDTNNGELRLNAYSEVEFYDQDEDYTYYNPEVINASLLVDETEVASLDLEIDWVDDFPQSADVAISVAPFTATLSFDDTPNATTLSVSLLKNAETIVAASVTARFENGVKTDEGLKSLEGYVQLRNIRLQGTVDVQGADNSEDPDLNDFIKLALYADGAKVGDVVFVYEDTDGDEIEETVLYVKYADGSQEKLETALQGVVDEIEALTEGLEDNG